MKEAAEDILKFWLEEIGPEGWYEPSEALDARIRSRYEALWNKARAGELRTWICAPRSALALIILLDQFPRNMFRGEARAFASDRKALEVAKKAVARGFDLRIDGPARQFFYLPLMHSETLADQDKCMRLLLMNLPLAEQILHSKAHREVIRRFGRFPTRNEALGRSTTPAEGEYLSQGGYGAVIEKVLDQVEG